MSIVLLRHAWAGERDEWGGDDFLRPLDERGRAQALALRDILLARGVKRVLSSPYVRCTQTVAPLQLEIEIEEGLTEGVVRAATVALLAEAGDGVVVACTHGDVIENVIGRSLPKGAAVVLDGLTAVEEIPAP